MHSLQSQYETLVYTEIDFESAALVLSGTNRHKVRFGPCGLVVVSCPELTDFQSEIDAWAKVAELRIRRAAWVEGHRPY